MTHEQKLGDISVGKWHNLLTPLSTRSVCLMPVLETNPYASLLALQGDILLCHTLQPLAHSADLQLPGALQKPRDRAFDSWANVEGKSQYKGLAKIKKSTFLTGLLACLGYGTFWTGQGLSKPLTVPRVLTDGTREPISLGNGRTPHFSRSCNWQPAEDEIFPMHAK